ncbi:DMT family transporter [Paenibacillus pasadenensis]|uniref:Permease of the drug/metabolite transporter (DMT) superfamily n=1 Tax=Paenibacillus pasadenensis TaxID=217090 RepID=A0A2N5N5S9_9BACL|nr:EamA family transporter [Paenibacillus pasadenensis]PLT45714.1 Permease of the drug/metabolite transporter (DMT) superfamily [Paenibacillus pasadenensis]
MVVLLYSLMCAIFGTTFLVIKLGVDAGLPPLLSASLRFFAAGALLLLGLRLRGKPSFGLLARKETWLIGCGSTFVTFATLYWAEQHLDSGTAAVLSATAPIAVLLLQSVFWKKRSTKLERRGALVSFAGVVVLLLPSLAAVHPDRLWLLSAALVLLGQIGYASGSLLQRRLLTKEPALSPIALNGGQMLAGGAGMALLSLLTERIDPSAVEPLPALASLLYLIVIGSMLGHSLFAWLIRATNAFFPSTWLYVSPALALGLGAALYGERLSGFTAAGSLIVLAGIVLLRLPELKSQLLAAKKRSREAA